jgi:hypothetical protein
MSRYHTKIEREPDDPELLTTEQFCKLVQIHPITAILWRRQGKGPAFIDAPDARFIRYRRDDILAWLERGRVDTALCEGGHRMNHRHAKAGR